MVSPCDLPATVLVRHLRRGSLRSETLVRACLDRIAALDGTVRAFITVDAEPALKAARAADRRHAAGEDLPPLHGMPVAIKDVTDTAGLRTTHGTRLCEHRVPDTDAVSVARLRQAGAIIIGKTNTPPFAFGAICTSDLQGPTANPWNTSLSSGGSSGGSAAAVACGMVPLAQGTDFGGSVRTPAAFCGIVGLRPTPGTIAEPERPLGTASLSAQGVLARSVPDALLMLDAMAGPHPFDPLSLHAPALTRPDTGTRARIAASADLGGAFRLDPPVRAAFDRACTEVERHLGPLAHAGPDMTGGSAAFRTLRAGESWWRHGARVRMHGDAMPQAFVWNVLEGRDVSATDLLEAEVARTRVWRAAMSFFAVHDVLLLPATSVLPFPNDAGEVTCVGGASCETIIDYLACTFLISLIGFPCLTIPVPVPQGTLPVGLQLVAPPGREALLWGTARRLERGGFRNRRPPILDGFT